MNKWAETLQWSLFAFLTNITYLGEEKTVSAIWNIHNLSTTEQILYGAL